MKTNTISEKLNKTGLVLEMVDEAMDKAPINAYYGVNVTKTNSEPIDQIQGFIIAKRIQEYNQEMYGDPGTFIVFIGGLFEVLNAKDIAEVERIITINTPKEQSKKELYLKIINAFNLKAKVLTTKDLWTNEIYFKVLKDLLDQEVFTRGQLINDTLNFYNSKEELFNAIKMKELPKDLLNLPLDFIKKIGNFPAPLLYTPAEVAESFTLNILERVNFKIGQAQERVYDKYLIGKMSSLRLKQSVALNSTKQKPITVTPYIDKEKQKSEVRLFFGESTESLKEKLNSIPKDNYIYSVDNNFGQVLNPIVEKAVYAVESALCQGNEYVEVFGQKIYSGEDLINFLSLKTIPFDQILVEIEPLIKKYILDINSKS